MAKRLAKVYNNECADEWRDVEHLRKIFFAALCIQIILLIIVITLSNWKARQTSQARLGVEVKFRFDY
jgi:hypothetical protein